MIISESLYVHKAWQNDRVVYGQGGFYREFFITIDESPDFKKLLAMLDKPLYALVIDKTGVESSQVSVFASEIARYSKRANFVIIPWATFSDDSLPIMASAKEAAIQRGITVTKALMYTKEAPRGKGDITLLEDPLNLLRQGHALAMKDKVVSASELSSAIWNIRNSVRILSYRQYAKLMKKEDERGTAAR